MTGIEHVKQGCISALIPFTENESLAQHTSFRIGGNAAVFCTPQDVQQLKTVRTLCAQAQVRFYTLGRGSNVLFADEDFAGVVINITDAISNIEVQNNTVKAFAGALLAKVCKAAKENALAGLEFAYGIPGCIGGAVYMNAGAYGGEMKDVLQSVTYLDENNQEHTLQAKDLALGYRTSIFEHHPAWCILYATLCLCEGNAEEIQAKMADYAQRRAEKQPLDMPSAGSTFKRPEGAFAGALIDQCGLRGFRFGGAAISIKHCGFVVNMGNATCADVLALTDEVCRIVQEKTGYHLEKEIRVVK